jgi:hypothetical protein
MATKTTVGNSYTEIAADVTAVSFIQITAAGACEVEVAAAAEAPADSTVGIRMASGETMTADDVANLGAAGAVYAIRRAGNNVSAITG